jgi:hypothetical protein
MPALWQSLSFPGAVHCAESQRKVEEINTKISKNIYKLQNHLMLKKNPTKKNRVVYALTKSAESGLALWLEVSFMSPKKGQPLVQPEKMRQPPVVIQTSQLPATTSGAVNTKTPCHIQTLATELDTHFEQMFFGKRPELLEQCFRRMTFAILLLMESRVCWSSGCAAAVGTKIPSSHMQRNCGSHQVACWLLPCKMRALIHQ